MNKKAQCYILAILNSNRVLVAMLCVLFFIGLINWWPASYWMEVHSIRVFDAKLGAPVHMSVNRKIKVPFIGKWIVNVKQNSLDGYSHWCTAPGETVYGIDAVLPVHLTLDWWTWGSPMCSRPPVGKYYITTTWIIKGEGILPDKTITKDSNIFEITK